MIFSLFLLMTWQPSNVTPMVTAIDVMAMNDEMRTFLEEMTDSNDPYRRLYTLVNTIFSDKFLNLEYDNSRTKTAIETFETRSGNCLSFTFMFVAMARELGINARFQEVYNMPTWDRQGKLVVLNRHINARVMIEGKPYDVDFNPWSDKVEFSKRVVRDSRAIAQYYNNIGAEHYANRDYETAAAWFRKSLEVNEEVSFTWSNLGVALRALERLEDAEFAYLRAIDLDKREYTAMNNLSSLYTYMGRKHEAKHYQEKVESYRKRNPYYHFSLGERAYAAGNYEASIDHFRRAIRRKDNDHTFYHALAKAYAKMDDSSKARLFLRKARAYAPNGDPRNRYSDKLDRLLAATH